MFLHSAISQYRGPGSNKNTLEKCRNRLKKLTLHFPHLLILILFTNLPDTIFLAVFSSMLKVPTPRLLSSLNDFCCVVTGFRGSDFTATEFLSCIMAACNSSSGDTGSSLSASSPGAKVASAIKVVKEIRLDLYLIRKQLHRKDF